MFPPGRANSFQRIPTKISGEKDGAARRGKGIFYNLCMRLWCSVTFLFCCNLMDLLLELLCALVSDVS